AARTGARQVCRARVRARRGRLMARHAVVLRLVVFLVTRAAVHARCAECQAIAVTRGTVDRRVLRMIELECAVLRPPHTRPERTSHVERAARHVRSAMTTRARLRNAARVVARTAVVEAGDRNLSVRVLDAVASET